VRPEAVSVEPPYWLAALGGYIHTQGYEVALIDAEAGGESPEYTAVGIAKLNPKLIGVLSTGGNLTASTWTMLSLGTLCRKIKEVTDAPLFVWGNHPTALPERTLREETCDYVVVGEGFSAVLSLCHYTFESKPSRDSILGLRWLENGELCGNGSLSLIKDMDIIPTIGWDLIPENQRHYRNRMHFAFEDLSRRDEYGAICTSLGCPFSCTFCAIRAFSGNATKMRYKSVGKALEEVDFWVTKRKVYYLEILDECFTADKQFVYAFCDGIIERGYNLSIWINVRIDMVDENLLRHMRKAGIKWLGYGIESCSQNVRANSLKQQFSYQKIKDVVDLTKRCGQYICGNMMFGLPGEKEEDMLADVNMFRELMIEYPNFYCTMAYPGSPLYDRVLKEHPEWLPDTWASYAQLSYETKPLPTEYLTAEEVLAFRDKAFNMYFDDNPRYFEMIKSNFGQSAVDAINDMLKGKMKRKILGD
jgi:radical SAM superfamily enzyme YgiQ (UPF0313 family)